MYKKNGITLIGNNTYIIMNNNIPVNNKFSMFSIVYSNNITIKGITFDANRVKRNPKETFCHTINIISSNSIYLENLEVKNSVVDGFYIASYSPENIDTYPHNIMLKNCKSLNSFRNGLSIVNGYDIDIIGGEYSKSSGTSPATGIDIEPNIDTFHPGVSKLTINGTLIKENDGWGILVSQKGSPQHIDIINCTLNNNLGGIKHTSINSKIKYNRIKDCSIGIESIRYSGRKEDHNTISNNSIFNCETCIKYSGFNGVLSDNVLTDCKEVGIHLNGNTTNNTKVSLMNNRIENCEKFGIYSFNFNEVEIEKNTIKNSLKKAMYLVNGKQIVNNNTVINGAIGIESVGSETVITDNTFEEISGKIIYYRENLIRKSSGRFQNNILISKKEILDDQIDINVKGVKRANNTKKKKN